MEELLECFHNSPEISYQIQRTPREGMYVRIGSAAQWYSGPVHVRSGHLDDALRIIADMATDFFPDSLVAKWFIKNSSKEDLQ